MLLSTIGALTSVILLLFSYPVIGNMLHSTLSFVNLLNGKDILFRLYIILAGTGMTLGWLCSWFAVHRYIVSAISPD
jgi:cell division transport system permease protein